MPERHAGPRGGRPRARPRGGSRCRSTSRASATRSGRSTRSRSAPRSGAPRPTAGPWTRLVDAHLSVATVVEMTTFNLRTLKLRSGRAVPRRARVRARAARARRPALPAGARAGARRADGHPRLDRDGLRAAPSTPACTGRASAASRTPCSTCPISAREYQATEPAGDEELRTPYLEDDRLDLSAWARDALALDAAGQDPLQARLRRPLPGLRQEPEPRAARPRRARARLPLGRACRAERTSL